MAGIVADMGAGTVDGMVADEKKKKQILADVLLHMVRHRQGDLKQERIRQDRQRTGEGNSKH